MPLSSPVSEGLEGQDSHSWLTSLLNIWSQAITELLPMYPVARAVSSLLKSSLVWSINLLGPTED